jgi:LPP20 lipoprotein
MRINFLTFILITVLLSSCKTLTDDSTEKAAPEADNAVSSFQNNKHTGNIDSFSLDTYPVDNAFLIATVTPRLQFDYEEEEYALLSACRQISLYYGAYISYQKLIDENIIGTVQKQQVDVVYDQDLALSFMDKLEVLKTDRDLDYFSALIKFDGLAIPDYPRVEIHPESKPGWINNPPDFEGYIIGVGVSGRRKNTYESWEMADKLALAEIANRISTNIQSGTATIERGGESTGMSTSVIKSLTVSDVHIKGLYILSRWRDPDSRNYYSLAITGKP